MTFLKTSRWLPALVLFTTLLVSACGGGDASPPAESVGPTVNIASDALGTATGPVTFRITFSEDVGSSFTADDVAVTSGTKGAFAQVSAVQYTLVVTPEVNASGSIGLTIAAASYTDLVGNNGAAGSASQAFDTRPPTVAISSSAAGSTATGDITFTFAFSKDVGTTFTADDVAVTGGTKGEFNRVDGITATLVVVPTANTSGTVTVEVAAGAVSDASGTTSTAAATASQVYNTSSAPTLVQIVRANGAGTPSYDAATGKALPDQYATGVYSANAGEVQWWGGNYPEQIQAGYGFSKTNTAQWGFGIFIAQGGAGWDISATDTYHFTLGTNVECVGTCKVTVRMVSASNATCVADAKVALTAADITTAYTVKLADFAVSGCATNTMAAFKAAKVAELHFQMLRADMQFTTSGDPTLFPNGLGMGGNIYFDVAPAAATSLTIVRANSTGTPSYDSATGKALPGQYATGVYAANAGEVQWWGGNYPEQIQAGYGFSKTDTAQWGFGIFIANGGAGWDIAALNNYHFTLGTNAECVGVCKVTVRMVSKSNPSCVADAKVTLKSADIGTAYDVKLADFTVAGCTTNTMDAFQQLKVAELHFQMLRADMQFTTSGDPTLYPNGLGVGGDIQFNVAAAAPARTEIVRANAAGAPSYDKTTGKALPGQYVTGVYSANAGEVYWWGGNYDEQIQAGYGFSKTDTAQWGFGIFIANGGAGWDIGQMTNYHFTLGTNAECVGVCKVTVRMVSTAAASCVADAKVTLTSADIVTAYSVKLSDFTVSGCATNTIAAFKQSKVAELHFQLLRADMQFASSGDPTLYPNGLGVGGNIYFD
jgi:Bacterial Ig-like domain